MASPSVFKSTIDMSSLRTSSRLLVFAAAWFVLVAATDKDEPPYDPLVDAVETSTSSRADILTGEFLQMKDVYQRISTNQAKRPQCRQEDTCANVRDRETCSNSVSSFEINVRRTPEAEDLLENGFACRHVSFTAIVNLEEDSFCFAQLRFPVRDLISWLNGFIPSSSKHLLVTANVPGTSRASWGITKLLKSRHFSQQWCVLDVTPSARHALQSGPISDLHFRVCVKKVNNASPEGFPLPSSLDLHDSPGFLTRKRVRPHGRGVAFYPFAIVGQLGGEDPLDTVNATALTERPSSGRAKRETMPPLGRPTSALRISHNETQQKNTSKLNRFCSVKPYLIDFRRDLAVKNVLFPKTFMANLCSGECGHKRLYISAHARLKALIRRTGRNSTELDGNCCVATDWKSVSILFKTKTGFRSLWYDQAVVTKCACS